MSFDRPLELRAQPRGLRRALEEDHAALNLLLEDMRNAMDAEAYRDEGAGNGHEQDRAGSVWNAFEARLRAHFALEEEYILPAFSLIDPEESAALVREHVDLCCRLRGIGVGLANMRTRNDQMVDFAERLEAHAKREDALMYRFTERRLEDPNARRAIASRLADVLLSESAAVSSLRGERVTQVFARGMSMDPTTRVAEIMTSKVIVLSEEDNLTRVAEGLEHFRFRHIPVVDGAKLVGMLTHHDVLRSAVAKFDHSAFSRVREARVLDQTFVRDVMCSNVLTIRPEELVQAAAERMLDEGVGALPVISESGEVIGIITETDVLRFVARRPARKPAWQ